LHRLIKEASL
jgi:dynein heavy chain